MVAAIAGVATVAGAAISSSGARSAANSQADATEAANAESARQYDNNVALQAPTINTGNAARDRLSYLLGLSPTGFGGTTSVGGVGAPQSGTGTGSGSQSYDQIRQQLLGQYTSSSTNPGTSGQGPRMTNALGLPIIDDDPYSNPANWRSVAMTGAQGDQGPTYNNVYTGPQTASTVDEQGLEAAIQGRLAEQEAAGTKARTDALAAAQADPKYGSLAQNFQFNTYTPDVYQAPEAFSYTGQDLYDDPSYKFRLEQGQKALDRQGAASGRFLSGAQLQASSNYNQGAASQEFQSAYNRALGTYGTNTTNGLNAFNVNSTNKYNAFNTNEGNRFNAYQANFSNAVNPLLSLAGSAQTSAQFLGNAGQQNAQIIGNNLTNQANATGAAQIASSNAISSGLNGAANSYSNNQLMNNLLNRNSSVNNNPGSSSYPSGYFSDQYAADR